MRETTSFRLKACNIAASEAHNDRTKEMKHVRKDLTPLNESYSYIRHSLHTENAIIKREYNANHKKALYKNAVTIKEGCLVLNDNCTMEDVKRFCDECHKRYGIIPLKIHIHRDEGHYDKKTGEWKPNLHAHVTFRMYGHKGEKYKLKPEHTTEMQDIAAQCLHMKRGKKSGKKGLDSIDYKIEIREKYLESLENAIENAENKFSKKGAKAIYEATKEILGGKMKKELDQTKEALKKAENTISALKNDIDGFNRADTANKDVNKRLLDKLNQQTEDIANVEAIRAERDQVIEDYQLKSAELNLKEQSLQKDYETRERKLKEKETQLRNDSQTVNRAIYNIKKNLDDVLKVTSGTSITTSIAIDIASGKDVELTEFAPDGKNFLKMSDIGINTNIVVRWSEKLRNLLFKAEGLMQKTMHDPKWRPLEDWINRFKTMLNDVRERSMMRDKSMGL